MLAFLRKLKRVIRRELEARARRRLFGPLAPLVPPVEAMYDGPAGLEEFKSNGEEFLRIYTDICGLQPDERMLDVGSGIGRKTIQLTRYFNESAVYEGIDVNASGIDWCQRKITSSFPNFRFQRIDVYNQLYNPSGTCRSSEYRFPFDDGSFTFVVLGSVFTHMLPADVAHYLAEVSRVLRVGGRCLISYFLLNDESRTGASTLNFIDTGAGYATTSPDIAETAIAFEQEFVESLYRKAGLTIVQCEYGSWCGRRSALSYQDLIVAVGLKS